MFWFYSTCLWHRKPCLHVTLETHVTGTTFSILEMFSLDIILNFWDVLFSFSFPSRRLSIKKIHFPFFFDCIVGFLLWLFLAENLARILLDKTRNVVSETYFNHLGSSADWTWRVNYEGEGFLISHWQESRSWENLEKKLLIFFSLEL